MSASLTFSKRTVLSAVASPLAITRRFSIRARQCKSAVVGVYKSEKKDNELYGTKAAKELDEASGGKLTEALKIHAEKKFKKGSSRVLYNVHPSYSSVAVCVLGKHGTGYNELEGLEEGRENIRAAVSGAVIQLRSHGETSVEVDPCGDPEAAAEGSHLRSFEYEELKAKKNRHCSVSLTCLTSSSNTKKIWRRGVSKAMGQNWARHLMETPANKMTPTIFADQVTDKLSAVGCKVTVRDKSWIESEKMGAFLSVSQGSPEPPVFLEIDYKQADIKNPIALVGKGVTFDSGGISIKPAASMDQMRADMGGAACTVGALYTVAQLKIPAHVKAFIPLCENMCSGTATRPGDVVTARNGKTIQVDNTDAEGRLILADALCYAETFNPYLILDMATLTGAIDVALGSGATGVFTNSEQLWPLLQKAGSMTGDRVWRMPLFQHYSKQVTESKLADVNNIGKLSRSGGSCTAAAFLKEFVTNKNWLHLDIAGVMSNKGEVPYLGKGMAGRPTRTIVEFIGMVAKQQAS